MQIKSHKEWFSHSKVDGGGGRGGIDRHTGDHIILLLSF
jgi:hypothetical protein